MKLITALIILGVEPNQERTGVYDKAQVSRWRRSWTSSFEDHDSNLRNVRSEWEKSESALFSWHKLYKEICFAAPKKNKVKSARTDVLHINMT